MSTVLITGASGFIAGHLARSLADAGHRVVGVSRSGTGSSSYAKVSSLALGDSLSAILASEPIDAIIHNANHVGDDEYAINTRGTRRWFDEAHDAGVKLQVLLSTLSASEQALSDYGKAKFALEQVFTAGDQVSLRLGIVAGDGGMFAKVRTSVGGSPVVPLLDNGTPRVYLLGIDFLCSVITQLVQTNGANRRGAVWSIQQPDPYTLRELMEAIRREYGFRCTFLPVPSLPILWALTLAERLPLKLPVSSSNLKGLRQSRHEQFDSHYDSFGQPRLTLDALVARAHELERTCP